METVAPGETGLITESATKDALIAALTAIFSDPSRLSRMSAYAPGWIRERFGWERSAAQIISTCEGIEFAKLVADG